MREEEKMAKRKPEEPPAGSPAWMATFSDLMNLLLCFFVLLFSMSTVDAQKFELVAASFANTFSIFTAGGQAIGDGILISNGVSQLSNLDEYVQSMGKAEDSEQVINDVLEEFESQSLAASEELAEYVEEALQETDMGGDLDDRIFDWQHNACTVMIQKACREKGLREYTCHDFRHTYISRLIRSGVPIPVIEAVSGDTQATIFKRYSHMFQGDEELVLIAMDN